MDDLDIAITITTTRAREGEAEGGVNKSKRGHASSRFIRYGSYMLIELFNYNHHLYTKSSSLIVDVIVRVDSVEDIDKVVLEVDKASSRGDERGRTLYCRWVVYFK